MPEKIGNFLFDKTSSYFLLSLISIIVNYPIEKALSG